MACRGFRFLFTIALCTTAFANSHESHGKSHDSACLRKYVIIEGDTCDKISAHQHVSTHQLAHTNKKINPGCTNLSIGDVLCLGLKGQDCTKVHVVKEGDICASVAKEAGIPLDDLFKNNPNINEGCTNIYPGEVLCVAPAVNSTTTISGAPAIKGSFPPFPFPLLNATHGSGNITFPAGNLTSSVWGDSTGTSFNASFPTFNSSTASGLNTSFPFVDTQSNFTLPAFNGTIIPAFNHTHSFKNSTNGHATATASANATDSAPLFGGLAIPNFAPTATSDSGGFDSTTTTTTSTTTTLSASSDASAGTSGSASVGSSTTATATDASGSFPPIF